MFLTDTSLKGRIKGFLLAVENKKHHHIKKEKKDETRKYFYSERSVEVETGGENGIADDRRREENFKRCISFNHPIIYAHMHFIR